MTYKELTEKMQKELVGYQIGLHNISLSAYKSIIRIVDFERIDDFRAQTNVSSEQDIANQILQTGLSIYNRPRGLRSTVTFLGELTASSLEYNYKGDNHSICNIIVAVPEKIPYKGENYFVGDLRYDVNVGNMLLFNPILPKEFIYGYYSGTINKVTESANGYREYEYNPYIQFIQNEDYWNLLSESEQQSLLERIFETHKHSLESLRLANNDSKLKLFLVPSFERFTIKETRKQYKTYQK